MLNRCAFMICGLIALAAPLTATAQPPIRIGGAFASTGT